LNEKTNGLVPAVKVAPVQKITLSIMLEMGPNGQNISVNGPVQDPVLCYGMLERAKDVIRAQTAGGAVKRSPLTIARAGIG